MQDGDQVPGSSATTLGQRLDAAGRRVVTRHTPALPWATLLVPALRRAVERSQPSAGRFTRRESAPVAPPPGAAAATGQRLPRAYRAAPPAPGAGPPGGLRAEHAPAAGEALPADVRAVLRGVAGPGADAVRLHTGPAAEALARRHGADAVTAGTDVHVAGGRTGALGPAGVALLAHEAVHAAAAFDPAAAHRRGRPGGAAAEERSARAAEAAVRLVADGPLARLTGYTLAEAVAEVPAGGAGALRGVPAQPAGPPRSAPGTAPGVHARAAAAPGGDRAGAASLAAAPAAVAMAAATDRDLPGAPGVDVEALKRSIVADLVDRLRTDFERGG